MNVLGKWNRLSIRRKSIIWLSTLVAVMLAMMGIANMAQRYMMAQLSRLQEDDSRCYAVQEALDLYERLEADPLAALRGEERAAAGEEEEGLQRLGQIREDIVAYIREHYTEELSMQDVARAMNYSDAYFCKLFKQCFKVNFSAWLNEFRVEKAKELLSATRLSVREVSIACGYADANYFARVFKRVTGMTPSEYRSN